MTNAKGEFRFKNLTPGDYRLKVWNERNAEPFTQVVHVKAGPNSLSLDVRGQGHRGVATDKFGVPLGPAPH